MPLSFRPFRRRRGAAAVEYVLLLGLVGGVILLSVIQLGRSARDANSGAAQTVDRATDSIGSDAPLVAPPPPAPIIRNPVPPPPGLAWSQDTVRLRYDADSYLSYGYASVVTLTNTGSAETPPLPPLPSNLPVLLVQDGDLFALVDGRDARACAGRRLGVGESCAMTLLLQSRSPGLADGNLVEDGLPVLHWSADIADFSLVLASARLDQLSPEGAGDAAIAAADFTVTLSEVGTRDSSPIAIRPGDGVSRSGRAAADRCGEAPVLRPQQSCTLPLRLRAGSPGTHGAFGGSIGFDGTVHAVRGVENQQQAGPLATGFALGDSIRLQATQP